MGVKAAATEVYCIYDRLNRKYFNNELPTVPIYIHPNLNKIACFDPNIVTVYDRRESQKCQMSFSDYIYSAPVVEVCEMMLHLMCHYYCFLKGIKDTSNKHAYHNKKFKETAESHGLIVGRNRYGYCITSPSTGLIEFVNNKMSDIQWGNVFRYKVNSSITEEALNTLSPKQPALAVYDPPSHHRKYMCMRCGISVRATKDVKIKCANCNLLMQLVQIGSAHPRTA